MRTLSLVLKLILFLLLLGLAARNSDPVSVRYLLGLEWQAPLSLVILIAFAVGLLAGLLACSARLLRNHRELRAMRKAAKPE
ncbi:MAG: LapA family protein [Pseudomonadota bacterium]